MDMFLPSWFLPTTLVLFFCSILMYTIRQKSSSIKLAPGPRRIPIIGNLHQVAKDSSLQTLWNLSEKYGPVMLLHLGIRPTIVISSTEMASEVLKTHDQKMCSRPYSTSAELLSYNYKGVAFSPYSDQWRHMRKALVTGFAGPKMTRLYRRVMESEMEGLVRSLSVDRLNTTVNIQEMLFKLVNDVVFKVVTGRVYKDDETFNGKTVKEILFQTIVMAGGGSPADIFPGAWIWNRISGWDRKVEECFRDLDAFLQTVFDEHRDQKQQTKTSDHEDDFVDDCMSRLTTEEAKALVTDVFEGSIDTTSISLVWTMSEIVKNPRVMRKLQDEIRSCMGGQSSIGESDISKMTYLKMVVKESLRLHPPVGVLMDRVCVSHCQIGGYDVLPGTKVLVNAWGIGRDPRIWKESPNEFIPERFENIDRVDLVGTHFKMIPFGGGRRSCPGYNFGVSSTEFVIANLLYFFNWEAPPGVKNQDLDMTEEGNSFIVRKTPLCLVPKKHNCQVDQ